MMPVLAFILGFIYVVTGRRPLVVGDCIMMLASSVLISIAVLNNLLPLLLLMLFPLALAFVLFKVLK